MEGAILFIQKDPVVREVADYKRAYEQKLETTIAMKGFAQKIIHRYDGNEKHNSCEIFAGVKETVTRFKSRL